MIKVTGEVAKTVVEGMKGQPLALPLVLVNLIFMGVVSYVLYEVSDSSKRRDALITELAKNCTPKAEAK